MAERRSAQLRGGVAQGLAPSPPEHHQPRCQPGVDQPVAQAIGVDPLLGRGLDPAEAALAQQRLAAAPPQDADRAVPQRRKIGDLRAKCSGAFSAWTRYTNPVE